jgi:hypothetical protein
LVAAGQACNLYTVAVCSWEMGKVFIGVTLSGWGRERGPGTNHLDKTLVAGCEDI